MPQSATILQELQELKSTLPGIGPGTGYEVPAGYFDSLAVTLLQRIKALEAGSVAEELAHLSPLVAGISNQSPYIVPADYFDSLDPAIAFYSELDAQEELENLSPLLGSLSKKHPFTLPEGYFEKSLPAIEKQDEAPVVRMASRNWLRLAVAASVAVIVGLGAMMLLNQNPVPGAGQQPYAWVEKNMKKVSTEEISRFVDLADATAPFIAKTDAADISSLLKNVSDNEIQDFLKDIPADDSEEDDILFN